MTLLPCPFCGGEADLSRRRAGDYGWETVIECNDCFAEMRSPDNTDTKRGHLVKMWNIRRPIAAERSEDG